VVAVAGGWVAAVCGQAGDGGGACGGGWAEVAGGWAASAGRGVVGSVCVNKTEGRGQARVWG
jgi:hypothetical protein